MNATVVYNTSSAGLTGITNLSMQSGSIGTIFGSTLLIGLLLGAIASAHSWNTKGWLYRAVKWLLANFGENVVYGIATSFSIYSIYFIGSEISKFGENNPRFLSDMAFLFGEVIVATTALSLIGFFTKPIWGWLFAYISGKTEKKVKKC